MKTIQLLSLFVCFFFCAFGNAQENGNSQRKQTEKITYTITGQVVDFQTKQPIKNTFVDSSIPEKNRGRSAVRMAYTGEDGRFSIETNRKGKYLVRIWKYRYDLQSVEVELNASKSIAVDLGVIEIKKRQPKLEQIVIKGKVLDKETRDPMMFGQVILKGTTIGVQTDFEGEFAIRTTNKDIQTILIEYIGFHDKEVSWKMGDDKVIDLGVILMEERQKENVLYNSDHRKVEQQPLVVERIIQSEDIKEVGHRDYHQCYFHLPKITDIEEAKQESIAINAIDLEIKYAPNPTSNLVNLILDKDLDFLLLTDTNGKTLLEFKDLAKGNHQIDLQEYPTGIYFLKFGVGNQTGNEQLIIAR